MNEQKNRVQPVSARRRTDGTVDTRERQTLDASDVGQMPSDILGAEEQPAYDPSKPTGYANPRPTRTVQAPQPIPETDAGPTPPEGSNPEATEAQQAGEPSDADRDRPAQS